MSAVQRFIAEARRRRVFRSAALYIVGAWVLIQVAEQFFQAWGIPDTALRYVWLGALAGFPVAAVFSWRYDTTNRGIVRTRPAVPGEAPDLSLRKSDLIILAALLSVSVAVLLGVADRTLQVTGQRNETPAAPEIHENSIAVMPFRNLGDDPDANYISDGLTYELTSYLARIPEFLVIASESTFALKERKLDIREIGRLLRVRHVVEGGVSVTGGRLSIDVRLVDTGNGFQIWQETFDDKLTDAPSLQSEAAGRIVAKLNSVLGVSRSPVPVAELTSVPEAYDYYLLGMHEMREKRDRDEVGDWVDRSIGFFQRAIDADPDFALAYVRLAQSNLVFLWTLRADKFAEAMANARRLIASALKLDPDLDAAYTTLARIHFNDFDLPSHELALERALEINPFNADALYSLGNLMWRQGRLNEARELIRNAAVRNPLDVDTIELSADLDAKLGNYERAKSQLLDLLRADVDAEPFRALQTLETSYGHLDEAARWMYQSYSRNPEGYFGQIAMLNMADELGAFGLAESWLRALDHSDRHYFVFSRSIHQIATGHAEEAARFVNDLISSSVPPPGQALQPNHVFLLGFGAFLSAVTGDDEQSLSLFQRLDLQSRAWLPLEAQISALATESMLANRLGHIELSLEYLEQAESLVQSIEEFGATGFPDYTVARALLRAARGDDEAALELLELAVNQGFRRQLQLRVHIPLRKYQDLPRFRNLLDRVDEDIGRQLQRVLENGWLVEPQLPNRGEDAAPTE